MCFSATASFISGTALCAIGVATLKQTKASAEIPFALIPLLFGIQQLTEGALVCLSVATPMTHNAVPEMKLAVAEKHIVYLVFDLIFKFQ